MTPKDEEIFQGRGDCKISKAVVKMANNFKLAIDENDDYELLEMVPEELTNKEELKLEHGHIAEDEAREKNAAGEENKQESSSRNFSEGSSRSFCIFQSYLNI